MEIQSGWFVTPAEPLRLRLPGDGAEHLCTQASVRIGRNPDCELCFRDIRTLSRYHAEIMYVTGKWYIRDTNSANGTWVNEKRLTPGELCPLKPGDKIRMAADVILEVLPMDPKRMAPPPEVHSDWRNDTVDFEPVCPSEKPAETTACFAPPPYETEVGTFCRVCGHRLSGPFCPMCGSRQDAPTRFSHPAPPTAPSMAPPTAPSMAPPPAPAKASRPAPPPAAKKPGLLGKLFGGRKEPTPPTAPVKPVAPVPPAAPPKPQSDDVQFRGAAPQNINPGEYFTVKIMMYREDDYQRADRETAAVAGQVKAASSGVFQADRGQKFRIVLQSPDVDLDAGDETLVWNGIFASADFEVFLPENYDRKQLRLRGRVYSGDAVLTDLKLILQVSAAAPQQVVCEKVQLRTAFISYASADRAKVVARLQGILLACPEMDLFFDVESLRRGEAWEPRLYQEISRRDLFYLFWSRNAADSQWVRKELEYAVSQKTVEFIEPIPLERPDICPPPEALMCKHFNDWTLRYLNNN